MTSGQIEKVKECYVAYCEVIKPLIAQIEAYSEKLPLPLFNEIRAFNDHIARCYYNNPSCEYIDEQITKAQRHITRITLDCFKCLNVFLYQRIELFDRQTRNVDLTVIDNGTFFPEYSRKRIEAATQVKEAKIMEAIDVVLALNKYQDAFNNYADIVESIDRISETVKWARIKFTTKRWLTVIGWTVSIIVSAIISAMFSCELAAEFLN